MTRLLLGLMSSAGLIAATAPALAQTPDFEPAYGTVALEAGFAPDPSEHRVRAGGAIDASNINGSCYGYITEEPTLALEYNAASFSLYVAGTSDEDTVLIVYTPEGEWVCNDDGEGGDLNPGIAFDEPQSGRYAIWLGTYSAGVGYPDSVLNISELGFEYTNPYTRSMQPNAPAARSVSLSAGFSPDPWSVETRAGGPVNADNADTYCFGYYSEAPSVRLNYEAGDYSLYLSGEGEFDGTLAVMTPSGDMMCDDDSAGSLNPGVVLNEPESGIYTIWLGTLSQGSTQSGHIHVSEIGFAGVDNQLDLSAEAIHGSSLVETGFLPDPITIDVMVGGNISFEQGTNGQLTTDGYCAGYGTRAPTYEMTYEAGSLPLYISASSDDNDLTLAVNAPDGSWLCNDDAYGSLNPGVMISSPASGVYDIYVGTYSQIESSSVRLHISETGFGEEGAYQPDEFDDLDFGDTGEPFALDIYADPVAGMMDLGSLLEEDPTVISLQAGGDLYAGNANNTGDAFCAGYVTENATIEINYDGDGPLYLTTDSDQDLTMIVNTPNGGWICDDDSGSGLNPAMRFEGDAAGIYDIWVGTYGGGTIDAELIISTENDPVEF